MVRASNFYTPASSNPLHFLYSFSLNARLKSPGIFLHMRASGNAVSYRVPPFVRLMNPLKDQVTILDTQHQEGISLSFSARKTIPQTAAGTFTPHRSVPEIECPWKLQLSPSPLKPDKLPRVIRNTDFHRINWGTAALLAAKLHFGHSTPHPKHLIFAKCPALGCSAAAIWVSHVRAGEIALELSYRARD